MKKILITGGTSGIGLEMARQLGDQGHEILVSGRNPDALKTLSGLLPGVKLHTYLADFSSMDQVWKLAENICCEHEHLDVLINNAGGANGKFIRTNDGFELTLAVNHLAPFLLSHLLLPLLRKAPTGRIINVASSAHYHGKIWKDDLHLEQNYFILKAYAQSKLANVMFTIDLANKLKNSNISVHAVHPGLVKTHIGSKNSLGYMGMIWKFYTHLRGIPVSKGADNAVWLAGLESAVQFHGKYFHGRQPVQPSPRALDSELRDWLWMQSMYMTGLPRDSYFS